MKSSSFKEVIRLQFNALMMITIKGEYYGAAEPPVRQSQSHSSDGIEPL